MEYAYAKGGKVIIQPNDYQKYRKIGIENKYEIEAFNDIGLSGINFDSVTLNNLLKKKFNDLLESYEDYVISEDSEAITRTIQQEIEARKLQGDSVERIKEYEAMLTNQSERERYIKDYADNQLKTLSEWVSYLKQSEYSTAFKYLILKAVLNYNYDYKLNKLIERNNKTVRNFVGFDAASLSELNQLNSDYLLKDYTEIQANNSANILKFKEVIKSSGNGKWIKFNGGSKTSSEERAKNAKELSQLVQNTYWCTKTNSQSQLNGGDFYVYVTETNGEIFPRIAIRMDEDNVGEVRGNKSAAQDIEEEMLPIAEDFLLNNIPNDSGKKWLDSIKYNSSVIAFKEKLIAEGTLFENSIELFFELKVDEKKYLVDYAESNGNLTEVYNLILAYIKKLKNPFYKKTDFHIGNITSRTTDEIINLIFEGNLKYIFGNIELNKKIKDKTVKIIGISGDAFFGASLLTVQNLGNLKYICGDADFENNSSITNLGNLTTIGGFADFRKSKIKNLSNLKIIHGWAKFEESQIKSLGNLTTIGDDAIFKNSKVENLGNLTTIGDSADFSNSQVKDLGNLISIGGDADFENSLIEDLGNLTTIGGSVLYFGKVKNLGNLISIGGDADFDDFNQVENLGNLTSIGRDVTFKNSLIKDLGNLKTIKGNATFSKSKIKDLGNLITIGGTADFIRSQIKNLGNLSYIGGNANFADSKIKNLANITTIEGNANFENSQVENLGNLTSIGGNAIFENSQVENLGKLTTILDNAYFGRSKIKDLGNLKTIDGAAFFGNSQVQNLGNLTTIDGFANFQDSKVENLGNLITIGGSTRFDNSKIKNLGNLISIGEDADFENSLIEDLGSLTSIGGAAYFENSEVENLGNLITIGRDADFRGSKVINLGNLTTIGGDAMFENSQVENLGNLREIKGSVIGKQSTAYKLWIKRKKAIKEGKFEKGGYLEIDLELPELSLQSLPDLLSSQEVEYKLGRKLHWWNDDIVYLSGIEYKKVYLRHEYKRVF
jgi:hypothetical protein